MFSPLLSRRHEPTVQSPYLHATLSAIGATLGAAIRTHCIAAISRSGHDLDILGPRISAGFSYVARHSPRKWTPVGIRSDPLYSPCNLDECKTQATGDEQRKIDTQVQRQEAQPNGRRYRRRRS